MLRNTKLSDDMSALLTAFAKHLELQESGQVIRKFVLDEIDRVNAFEPKISSAIQECQTVDDALTVLLKHAPQAIKEELIHDLVLEHARPAALLDLSIKTALDKLIADEAEFTAKKAWNRQR